jgi:hypothetical protein
MKKNILLQMIDDDINRLKEDATYRATQGVNFTPESLIVLRKLLMRAVTSGKQQDFNSFYKYLADGVSLSSNLSQLVEKIAITELGK